MVMKNWSLGRRPMVGANVREGSKLARAFKGIGEPGKVPVTMLESACICAWEHLW